MVMVTSPETVLELSSSKYMWSIASSPYVISSMSIDKKVRASYTVTSLNASSLTS